MAPLTLVKLGAGAGVLLSLYALYVEMEINAAKAMGTDYKAACDMGTFASCSKVLASSYAHILSHWELVPKGSSLDISNAAMGLAFYMFALVFNHFLPAELMLVASVGTIAYSGYLAYVLKFVLKDFCLVCLGMYIANFLIFIGVAQLVWGKINRQAKAKQT